MSDLRRAVIRLAHENPEMRADLLPLLKEAASVRLTPSQTVATAYDVVHSEYGKFELKHSDKGWWLLAVDPSPVLGIPKHRIIPNVSNVPLNPHPNILRLLKRFVSEKLDEIATAGGRTADQKTAYDEAEEEAHAILKRELAPLKGGDLWKPPHNLALNFALMGANLWVFTILPMFWKKKGYRTIDGQEGIVIHPIWASVSQGGTIGPKDMSGFSHLTPEIAHKIVKAIKARKTIPETVGMELKALQQQFGIKIPAGVSTKIINQSVKVAKRRWSVNRLRVKDRFIPLDGSKPRDLGSWD
jgi:hypothetical protein